MKNALKSAEFRDHWPIVLAALLGVGSGLLTLPIFTIGLIAPELHKDFGWSRGQIMIGLTIQMVVVMLLSPLMGMAADRFSVRKVGLTSLALFSCAMASLALNPGNLTLFYVQWGVMTAAGVGTLPNTWMRAINLCFDEHKGLAFSLSLLGSGLCGILIKPYVAWAIGVGGWRFAYLAIAILPVVIALPVGWFVLPKTRAAVRSVTVTGEGHRLPEALRDWRFWILVLSSSMISFAIAGVIPNQEGILSLHGFDKVHVVETVALFGVGLIIGRLSGGFLIDLFWAPAVAFVLLAISSSGLFILAMPSIGLTTAAIATLLVGFASGFEYDVIPYLISRYFGQAHFSAINGSMMSLYYWAVGVGPWVFALAFDHYGNYALMLKISVGLILLGALPLLILGRYRYGTQSVDDPSVQAPGVLAPGSEHRSRSAGEIPTRRPI